MKINVLMEENVIYISYSTSENTVKEKLDYNSIERLIDYVMANKVADCTVEPNGECEQYVTLLQEIISKINTEDFKRSYASTVNTTDSDLKESND